MQTSNLDADQNDNLDSDLNNGDIWLFGYGSLIWRPDFPFVQQQVAVVDGWVRKFWQGSHDHRGVPEAPGRVVTLLPATNQQVAGMAFQIDRKDAREIFHALDYREKNGYERQLAPCLLVERALEVNCIFYVATETNPAYLGPAPLTDLAQHINRASGPSGSNREYLLQLANALRQLNLPDDHVFALEREVLSLQPDEPND